MKKLTNRYYGASLVALAFSLNAVNVNAQTCTAAPSCEILGFTKSSSECSGKTSLKCPFDTSKFFCLGDGEGGGGQGYCGSPEIGDVLYSDMTCARLADLDKNKRVIGVIFDQSRRLAVALEEREFVWGASFVVLDYISDINRCILDEYNMLNVPRYKNVEDVEKDFNGKGNTKRVIVASEECKETSTTLCHATGFCSTPAFDYVNNYNPGGTSGGKWYVPASGELNLLYKNKTAVNTTMNAITGTPLNVNGFYWTSAELNVEEAWSMHMRDGSKLSIIKYNPNIVRPVLSF